MRELTLLQHVYDASTSLGDAVVVPPGDDLALLRLSGRELLVGVDQVVAGRHFTQQATMTEVGRKAVNRSLSDVAAMAGRPVAALAAVVLPRGLGTAVACALFDAMRRTASAAGCPLVGGDIAIHGAAGMPLTCSVTVLAEPTTTAPVLRSGVQPGDTIYVTGKIGGAVSGDGGGRHLAFEPRIRMAIDLAATLGDRLHAMIDLSDGLGRDAARLARASRVVIEIDAARLPLASGVGWREGLGDGEDYELCFAAQGAVPSGLDGVPITAVGRAEAAEGTANAAAGAVRVRADGRVHDGAGMGWEHDDGEAT